MHLLAAKPGGFHDDEGIIDLKQTPADIVILSAQDTTLGLLAHHCESLPDSYPSIRLANLIHLNKPAAYDLYEHAVLRHASLIVVSLLGGSAYWRYGVEQLVELSKRESITLVIVPGDDQVDVELQQASSCDLQQWQRIWTYLREGGRDNAIQLLHNLTANYFSHRPSPSPDWREPKALPACLIYHATRGQSTLNEWQSAKNPSLPTALLLFYRSHVVSGNTQAFDEFIDLLSDRLNVLPVAARSLKNTQCLNTVNHLIEMTDTNVIINTTSFSHQVQGNAALSSQPHINATLFSRSVPVLQAILAANDIDDWANNAQGLRARDIAMNIALPEYDGRIITRAISFKTLAKRADRTQTDIIRYQLHTERASFVGELAKRWAMLARLTNNEKHVALILANYPTRDGRIGNGVGLDTPASTLNILRAMQSHGYAIDDLPQDSQALLTHLQRGATNNNDLLVTRDIVHTLSLDSYQRYFQQLPIACQQAVMERWGDPRNDPRCTDEQLVIAGRQFGNTFVGIQPSRGFNVDVVANYHDPDLVPPHSYLAFYFWVRHEYGADAIAHIGKHGNLEWLPGKSVALSASCWPDVALGPLPHLYPFIVNDPGEGAQAKRRAQAVILDHLMPPMARAETYGELLTLENLIDEYYQALGLDARRETHLREQILELLKTTHLREELSRSPQADDNDDALLNDVDTYLCELKEAQIRHGLHRFGQPIETGKLSETLVALTRMPRGEHTSDASIIQTISEDLKLTLEDGLVFDALQFDAGQPWQGVRPALLADVNDSPWRTHADTRERLELLAQALLDDATLRTRACEFMPATASLLQHIDDTVQPAVEASPINEIDNFMRALSGHFVPAGPSGAPTRGRLDVLPTGRNFYSLDARAIPTPAAWELGQRSAEQLIAKHLQEHGDYPRQLGLSVWGTSTMRTGGDDIAQAFALMGVQPVWAQGSNRVIDIEVIPGMLMNRPRVDVTLRISGFFRDAFPNVARLFDQAVQALATLEEPGDSNTIRAHARAREATLIADGVAATDAAAQSRMRIFGSKPGSYGAGLQGLIDERVWQDGSDLAQAYVNWGGYSYSQASFGHAAFAAFEQQLGQIEAVVQNQDNREHDLLDSDDYYQFQGGMANAVSVLRGEQPAIYHGDHSNPSHPQIRTLKEELNRVIRSRVTNPKWIGAMREHGYKGAFEMAASVDYLFAYDATTGLIDDYQYESVTDALINDPVNKEFMLSNNPQALKEMAERLLEAQQRGLWQSPADYQQSLVDTLLSIEESLEGAEMKSPNQ